MPPGNIAGLVFDADLWIGPEEEGGSDDAEEMSVNTESGADTTDQDGTAESPPGSQPNPQQEAISSRSRASNVAALRGLGIRVEGSDGLRPSQTGGLPASPRPPRSPRSAHPQAGATSGTSAPSQ